MKYGIIYANVAAPERASALELAGAAERLGFESLWTIEHVAVPSGYQSKYPYSKSGRGDIRSWLRKRFTTPQGLETL